ncbi:putative transmembrane protein [Gregarina niphandrodes]|uniref:Transmembrane protein n=1 Tax=Gregarina niphandrodes TaxID=110365 RepID=A0A023BDC8_GRENI|nr:putative transmembrane protein [Gregarina niphandrodes]EZG88169.1 putative transmembrane protein [Gregarina niphandrodes]|eukprot:XP_011128593.1 putative transmembrane protein [Gregarina niphandrodes]
MFRLVLAAVLWTCVCLILATIYLCFYLRPASGYEAATGTPLTETRLPVISISVEKLVCEIDESSQDGMQLATPEIPSIIAQVVDKITLVMIAVVTSDAEEAKIRDWFCGNAHLDTYIPVHRLVFCESATSRVSIVRQLNPNVHLECDQTCLAQMSKIASINAIAVATAPEAWELVKALATENKTSAA